MEALLESPITSIKLPLSTELQEHTLSTQRILLRRANICDTLKSQQPLPLGLQDSFA